MRITCLTLAMFASASLARATDYYVASTGGSDTGPGSLAAPFATYTHALAVAQPGDTVFVRGGTYRTRVSFPRGGTATAPIVFRAYPGETPIIDMSGQTVTADNSDQPVISVLNVSHIVVQGFTIQNWSTTDANALPEGILVGAQKGNNTCSDVRILGNTIHHIEQSSTDTGTNNSGDAHGIKVVGRSKNPLSGIVVDGNHLYSLRLGNSESLVLNGNVTDWRVTNNRVHDNNNIGIDFIGYENLYDPIKNPNGLDPALDRARNGVCAGNVVYNIDARFNPAYGGDFVTGGGQASADGIYVDGGTQIIVERNLVYGCNYGIEIASEADLGTGFADAITVRNNLIRHCHQAGIIMGGYNANKGTTTGCTFNNNTLYMNGTLLSDEQITIQHHVTNNLFRNNIVFANSGRQIIAASANATTTFSSNVFSHNLYYSASGAPLFNIGSSKSLSAWQSATSLSGGDAGSTAENPMFEETTPTLTTPLLGFRPTPNSPAVNTGQPSPAYQPGSGEQDLREHSRLRGGRVDRGAFER